MLKQSCFGESATGAFASCGTARDTLRPATGYDVPGCDDAERPPVTQSSPPVTQSSPHVILSEAKDLATADGIQAEPARTSSAGITEQDVKIAQTVIDALELQEEEGGESFASPKAANDAFSEAVLTAPLPEAVEKAAEQTRKGEMRVNQVSGPAIPAAPRTKRVAPADPKPAEGEVSLSFEVHRDSAATRAAKAQKAQRQKKAKGRGGFFRRLRGRSDNDA
jgi:hypothetical protein